jgi:hypothetical protein
LDNIVLTPEEEKIIDILQASMKSIADMKLPKEITRGKMKQLQKRTLDNLMSQPKLQ